MHILLIDDKIPDPHFGAGFPRAYRLLLALIELGHSITFFPSLKSSLENLDKTTLKKYGVNVCEDLQTLKTVDLAIISRPHNMHYYMPVVRMTQPKAKIIYDTEALWNRRYDLQLSITGRLPAWAYRYDELGMAKLADLCFVVNTTEKNILKENGAKAVVLAHALEIHSSGLPFRERKNVLVVGGILEKDSSNEDALYWYLENAWKHMNLDHLNVTGKVTSPRLTGFPNVTFLDHVSDLVPLYESHRIFIAATRFATGIPWKCHEAMAHGIPCVVSPLLASQLGVTTEALVAESANDFIAKSIELYSNEKLWNLVREKAFDLIQRDCDPAKFKNIIATSLELL